LINEKEYIERYNQKGSTIWITGLHGSGKNELAFTLERKLFDMGATVITLDGKSTRSGLSRELDFSPADRAEHLRRIAHIAKILNDQGIITICSFASPDQSIREQVKEIIGKDRFNLLFMDAPLEFCKNNANDDLYEKAEKGELTNIPGVDLEFEKPENADLVLTPPDMEKNIEKVIDLLERKKIFPVN
jgi:bifunctional enzyme CysN/CysC